MGSAGHVFYKLQDTGYSRRETLGLDVNPNQRWIDIEVLIYTSLGTQMFHPSVCWRESNLNCQGVECNSKKNCGIFP